MTNWKPGRPKASSCLQPPGIFLNVEFGVSFSPSDRPHSASMNYVSRRMEERLHEQSVRWQHEATAYHHYPGFMPPGNGANNDSETRDQHQQGQRRLGVRTREQRERGASAPPTFVDRNQPVSPMDSIPHFRPRQHTSSMPLRRRDHPLPPTPSEFRLGEANMPWSVPPWYQPAEEEPPTPTMLDMELENGSLDDPQRVRDLETLHQAMMTVDSLAHEGWESWTWDTVGDMPRAPRGLGWAVSSRDAPVAMPLASPPPTYAVSQWDQGFGNSHVRRTRSGL